VLRLQNSDCYFRNAALAAQGVTNNVIADMFGMALSTYHRRVRAASDSKTDVGRSVWEAALDFIRAREPVSGSEVQHRFKYDDAMQRVCGYQIAFEYSRTPVHPQSIIDTASSFAPF
jgi:hypothetical protein